MKSGIVVVDLKELEWIKVLEVTVPPELVWLGLIHMMHPVQFELTDLESLVSCIRERAAGFAAVEQKSKPRQQVLCRIYPFY